MKKSFVQIGKTLFLCLGPKVPSFSYEPPIRSTFHWTQGLTFLWYIKYYIGIKT